MANMAFNAAQCTDPSYTQAWIGQATIAEMFENDEAMDLYRHSHELGTHVCTICTFFFVNRRCCIACYGMVLYCLA